MENVVIHNLNRFDVVEKGDCQTYYRRASYYVYTEEDPDIKMVMFLDNDWDGWATNAKAKIETYYKSGTSWYKWYTKLYVGVEVDWFKSLNCSFYDDRLSAENSNSAWTLTARCSDNFVRNVKKDMSFKGTYQYKDYSYLGMGAY